MGGIKKEQRLETIHGDTGEATRKNNALKLHSVIQRATRKNNALKLHSVIQRATRKKQRLETTLGNTAGNKKKTTP